MTFLARWFQPFSTVIFRGRCPLPDPILTHNVWDIVSMAALLSALVKCVRGDSTHRTSVREYNLGLRYLRMGYPEHAFPSFQSARRRGRADPKRTALQQGYFGSKTVEK